MTEEEYINLSDLLRVRTIKQQLRNIIPEIQDSIEVLEHKEIIMIVDRWEGRINDTINTNKNKITELKEEIRTILMMSGISSSKSKQISSKIINKIIENNETL